ncbi:hypothetical protein ACFFMR_17325 [Micromonospora andamanensis]|uniref:DUF2470 domain-containing protein n=1 Tax=Micromonospora andamanensis TaxID=1287068 RepID=A0ABQ4HZ23_9ACTN|nr:hypothetical protein [Micromonospora andamanensis]GIJ10918.1 hypothetical protein Van01_41320 [Micromonospora andamanensis]
MPPSRMQPSRAELARTLVSSTTLATVVAGDLPAVTGVRHGADADGRVLLICHRGDPLTTGARDVFVEIADEPPLPFSPGWGRVRIGGRAIPLSGTAARVAADVVATTLPDPDLLDIGHGTVIVEVVPSRVTLLPRRSEPHEAHGSELVIDLADYRDAGPDPVAPMERPLLVDLVDHHGPQLYPFLRRQLVASGVDLPADCLPCLLRLDRYGMLVSVPDGDGTACYRLCFTPPLDGQQDLLDRLHPVLFHDRCDHT